MLHPTKLQEALRYEGGVSRRLFLAYAASLSSIPLLARQGAASSQSARFSADPFSLGIASGDPSADGAVLWTRLAPKPLEPGGGMAAHNVDVTWEVAGDEAMRNVVRRGTAVAAPALAHSVHVEVDGLQPNRWYWYRFRAGEAESPIGRTRTMPAADSTPDKLQFAFASCQDYEDGYFTAYQRMAEEELDLVFHLGDYIYEDPFTPGHVRDNLGPEPMSLDDYRIRHALYKSDRQLQAMHARCPWMVTWDDHELDNDYAGDISEEPDVDPAKFLTRRAGAYQAYYEMMPLRKDSLPRGPELQLYRKLSFGRLAEFLMLDTRQYRTDQPYAGEKHDLDERATSPKATILGRPQMQWLQSSLADSPAAWNVLAQQVLMAMVDFEAGSAQAFSMEKWPAYLHDREDLVQFMADHRVANPVVLTGDIHSNWVNDLRVDDRKPESPVVATEFVGTSICSGGNGEEVPADMKPILAENPFVRFHNQQRGYVRCTLTPNEWRTDFRIVEDVTRLDAPIKTRASFVIESGKPGAHQA